MVKEFCFLLLVLAFMIVAITALGAKPQKCPVARSCSEAKQICEMAGYPARCHVRFEYCKATGEVGTAPYRCIVEDRR
jgi:hypothetical protein